MSTPNDETTPLLINSPRRASSTSKFRQPSFSSNNSPIKNYNSNKISTSNILDSNINNRPNLFHSSSSTSISSNFSNSSNNNLTINNDFDTLKISKNKFFENKDKLTYLSYYLPVITWLPNYNIKENFTGDFIAGASLASFLVPFVMSFACLAHVDVRCGLFGIIVSPVIYSIFGSCSFLVTGPDASLSLMIGNLMDGIINDPNNNNKYTTYDVLATCTLIIGLVLLICGLFRFGFLVNVVSQALLNGFIAALGIMMIISELLIELGLSEAFAKEKIQDATTFNKLSFILKNLDIVHPLSAKISICCVTTLYISRHAKKHLIDKDSKNFGWLNFFPEIMIVVIVTIILSHINKWNEKGVHVIGKYFETGANIGGRSDFTLPLVDFKLIKKCFGTSLVCAIIGFFGSSTATKALESSHNLNFSMNRELVALGLVNTCGSFFTMLPSFGGYARTKINCLTCKSQFSGVILAMIALVFKIFFIEIFYFLPECVLASIITAVALSLVEESPKSMKFYWTIRGYDEIGIFILILLSTWFWSAELGLSLGLIISVIKVIKFSTRTKIQILGRVPKTNVFRNADELIEETFELNDDVENNSEEVINQLENIENCLIIKITEPLIFANSNELKSRLKRLEKYRSLNVHPSQKSEQTDFKYIIFDCKNMIDMDSSAALTLFEIVKNYSFQDYIILFTRLPFDLNLRNKFIKSGITKIVKQSLEKYGIQQDDEDVMEIRVVNSNSILSNRKRTMSSNQSFGLGEGFYTSIDEALKVVNECELRRNRMNVVSRS